jgi:DNA-binding winged helix-turn-helix (wHTH) protein
MIVVNLSKEEVQVLSKFVERNLKIFKLENFEKSFWNDAYHVDELESILQKLKKCQSIRTGV